MGKVPGLNFDPVESLYSPTNSRGVKQSPGKSKKIHKQNHGQTLSLKDPDKFSMTLGSPISEKINGLDWTSYKSDSNRPMPKNERDRMYVSLNTKPEVARSEILSPNYSKQVRNKNKSSNLQPERLFYDPTITKS